jgi:hypothetical protein
MKVFGIIIVILIIIGATRSDFDAGPKVSNSVRMCSDAGYAWVVSNNFVKRELKSPSSAEFPSKPDSYTFLGDCRHSIVGTVESQNAFGTMTRATFSVTMEYQRSINKWRAEDLSIFLEIGVR